MALERSVIRWLYGRPLETLLATWGISLFLIQLVRQIFGAQNVEVANPAWMSGGIEFTTLMLPYNRIVIIAFAFVVLVAMGLVLSARGSGCSFAGHAEPDDGRMRGRPHRPRGPARLRPGLGHRRAGRRRALPGRQRRPGARTELHHRLVHGRGAGRGGAARRHGVRGHRAGRGDEAARAVVGAVLTKILILVLIIAFIQKRPQGLFALKGRAVEA